MLLAFCAVLLGVAGVVSAMLTARETGAGESTSGDIDADVVEAGACQPCQVLATLQGSVDGKRGFVAFTPVGSKGKPDSCGWKPPRPMATAGSSPVPAKPVPGWT